MANSARVTREMAIAGAGELQLPAPVMSLVMGRPLRAPLDIFFGTADEFYLSPWEVQAHMGAPTLLPLWDDGSMRLLLFIYLARPSSAFP